MNGVETPVTNRVEEYLEEMRILMDIMTVTIVKNRFLRINLSTALAIFVSILLTIVGITVYLSAAFGALAGGVFVAYLRAVAKKMEQDEKRSQTLWRLHG